MKIFIISILTITVMIVASFITQSNQILQEVSALPKYPTPTIISAIDGDGLDLTKTKIVSSHPKITFQFKMYDPNYYSYECKLDNNPWKTCTSPITYTLKSPGDHKFSVKVYDKKNPTLCLKSNPDIACVGTLSWTFEQ